MIGRVLVLLLGLSTSAAADEFGDFLKPLFARHCAKCHGERKVKGKVNLVEIGSLGAFLARPKLIKEMIDAVSANDMPPEKEPPLPAADRTNLLATLRTLLGRATAGNEAETAGLHRLNRFQYNNSVRDLLDLRKDVFRLPERLMTRHSRYVTADRMPDQVDVSCDALRADGGFKNVRPFPKDLRAAHGFDNQANQLTLSPLLLDGFLKLSVSIVDSPDFTPDTVGTWKTFFAAPAPDADRRAELRKRLAPFLRRAFRRPVDRATIDRYVAYAEARLAGGAPFPDTMKKVVSAVLSSPMFLYRAASTDPKDRPFDLASRLSYLLWASGPDDELLDLAANGDLAKPDVLQRTLDRMLSDPKIERFLDTFPAQWMQLENLLGATPDPKLYRLFDIDSDHPASLQMMCEPLLLFDAVFIEDRPIVELIEPPFTYRSDFLRTWYTSDLKPPDVDEAAVEARNRRLDAQRAELSAKVEAVRAKLRALEKPVRERLLAGKTKGDPVDLGPAAAWEFEGNLRDAIGGLHLKPQGGIRYENGAVVLERAYLRSGSIPFALKAKTLEVWLTLPDVNQRGGGAMSVEANKGRFFDAIVLGERKPREWISGSENFRRTEDFPGAAPEERPGSLLQVVITYGADGTITAYRNGQPYGKPYRKDLRVFPAAEANVLFGLRHSPPGGNKLLSVNLDRARLYARALTPEEVAASFDEAPIVTEAELLRALTPGQLEERKSLLATLKKEENARRKLPRRIDLRQLRKETDRKFLDEIRRMMRERRFVRTDADDPRYGGVITNAAMLSMTSGPRRTHPIARGAWIIEVILNDPPPPPPNDVPPLKEEDDKHLTIRERFAKHRENPDCAGCHSRLDPLGFALENFDIAGRWRDRYPNNRKVDAAGTLMKKHRFEGIIDFKKALVTEENRFARAFTAHLLRFALARALEPGDLLTVEKIVASTAENGHRLRSILREIVLSDRFRRN